MTTSPPLAPVLPAATAAVVRRKRRGGTGEAKQGRWALFFLGPWLIGVVFFTAGPMVASLLLSFTRYDLFGPPEWIGLDNYTRMLTDDPTLMDSLRTTAIYSFVGTPLELVFAFLIAVLLNAGARGTSFYRSVFYLPSLFGGSVAVAVLWRRIFSTDGIVNQLLALVGVQGPSWISDPAFSLGTLIALEIWQFGAPMVIFLAGLRQIPAEYYEAAMVDGAGVLARFLRITIPLMTPIIFFNLILGLIRSLQAFAPAFVISGGTGGPLNSTLLYSLYLYQQAFSNFNMGYASAMAWLLLVISGLVAGINFLFSRKWVIYAD